MTTGLCAVLFKDLQWSAVFFAAVAQHFFSFFYYSVIVGEQWKKAHARDKGVYSIEDALERHSMGKSVVVSFFASLLRALFIVAAVNLFKLKELSPDACAVYSVAAAIIATVSALYQHLEFWSQRSIAIQFFDVLGDFSSALIAAVVLAYFSG